MLSQNSIFKGRSTTIAIIKIRNHEVEVDIAEELADYDWGYNAKWSSSKLVSASPFRDDRTPSFFISLEGDYAGAWSDSGAYDDDHKSGGLAKLLAYLRSESIAETEDYLLERYGRLYTDAEDIRLPTPRLIERNKVVVLPAETVTPAISPYLTKRGISADIQRQYGVGYTEGQVGYTALPWHLPDGRLANVKYRSTKGKRFFYVKGATQIRQLVYGMSVVNSRKAETSVICEAEIDAMSWASVGVYGIATGGSHMTRTQADIIKRSSIRRLILGGDNDAQGRRFNAEVERLLKGSVELFTIEYADSAKDANDILRNSSEALRKVADNATPVPTICLA